MAKDMCGIFYISRILWSLEAETALSCFRTKENFFRAIGRMAHDCLIYKQPEELDTYVDKLVSRMDKG
jgi:hypothetical protein